MRVEVEKVNKRFQVLGNPAVHDVSFEAPAGGITTLLGPSGSGKTTLLRIIAGLEQADSGRVRVGEEDMTMLPVQARGFGFVFQGFALFNHMSVRANIAFGLHTRKWAKAAIDKRVDELLHLVQLDGLGDRYPSQLSGGQKQRVGFARALAPQPRVLLLDEPFGALDARVRAELRMWLLHLHESTHLTTLLVTHDQDEALELSDRIVVMDEGHVHQVGTPEEIYEKPATSFVASFVGSANLLSGHVENGRAAVGTVSLFMPTDAPEGARVNAYVRPHDIHLSRNDTNESSSLEQAGAALAHIIRVAIVGGQAKLDLRLSARDKVTVHISRREFDALGVKEGDTVYFNLKNTRVFVEDYVI
jgi:sulfate transport system ATP-binding protein